MKFFLASLIIFIAVNLGYTQESVRCAVDFVDGSNILTSLKIKSLKVQNKYGMLDIPLKDINLINFGYNCEESLLKEIERNYRLLDSSLFKERNEAMKYLFNNYRYSIGYLFNKNPMNLEPQSRLKLLLSELEKIHGINKYKKPDFDTIYTCNSEVFHGKIQNKEFLFLHELCGELNVKTYHIHYIYFFNKISTTYIDAEDCFQEDSWIEVGAVIGKFSIQSSGTVDLWPQTPGQNICGPDGLNGQLGQNSTYNAGTLIGKLVDGQTFIIGKSYEGFSSSLQTLRVRIVRSPWNVKSVGKYKIQITR